MPRQFEHLIPVEYSELLRQAKTSGEVAFVCRVMMRKRVARNDTIRQICKLYGLDFGVWERNNWVDNYSTRVVPTETESETNQTKPVPF